MNKDVELLFNGSRPVEYYKYYPIFKLNEWSSIHHVLICQRRKKNTHEHEGEVVINSFIFSMQWPNFNTHLMQYP